VKQIYLDYNATTPIDPAVVEAMLPYLQRDFGNPSSTHRYGQVALRALDKARNQVASLLNASPLEIVFTGGGSEATNQAIKGAVFAQPTTWQDSHIIISSIEHPATYAPCAFLESLGVSVTVVPVDFQGLVDPEDIRRAITPKTRLISIMHSNNEVGTIQPIREIARTARDHGVLMHADAAQSIGKVPIDVDDLNVDLLTVAGHKLYAPKGTGVLFVRRGVSIPALIHGAGHERGRRAGTENVPYIVGLGKAAELAELSLPEATERLCAMRSRLENALISALGTRLVLNGYPKNRLPNTANISFLGKIGSELLEQVPGIAASTGAACHEGQHIISPVLKAMGVSEEVGRGAIRLSVGRFTTESELDQAAEMLIDSMKNASF
jgi:cysteine desulfurase